MGINNYKKAHMKLLSYYTFVPSATKECVGINILINFSDNSINLFSSWLTHRFDLPETSMWSRVVFCCSQI